MSDHYLIIANQGHLRIFQRHQPRGQTTPAFVEMQTLDFPTGAKNHTAGDSDLGGRFQGSKHQAGSSGSPVTQTGMSNDERLRMQREEERRRAHEIADAVAVFLQARPLATWDFAAGPGLHSAVTDLLQPSVRARLQHSLSKDLVHQSMRGLQTHFATL